MNELTQTGFDYATLPATVATNARVAAERIKLRLKRTVEDIIEIGRELSEIKAQLPHGSFLPWIASEFEMTQSVAYNFMQAQERFGGQIYDNHKFAFRPTVLYMLAAPSTPDEVVEKAIEKVSAGENVTVADVRDWKAEYEQANDLLDNACDTNNRLSATLRYMQKELNDVKSQPETVVKVEVAPEDYQTTKDRAISLESQATKLQKEIESLRKQQSKLVQDQVAKKLKERETEIADLDKKAKEAEARLESLRKHIDTYSFKERILRVERTVIEKTRMALVEVAAHIEETPQWDMDHETARLWTSLADMLRQGASAIEMFTGKSKPQLTVVHSN